MVNHGNLWQQKGLLDHPKHDPQLMKKSTFSLKVQEN